MKNGYMYWILRCSLISCLAWFRMRSFHSKPCQVPTIRTLDLNLRRMLSNQVGLGRCKHICVTAFNEKRQELEKEQEEVYQRIGKEEMMLLYYLKNKIYFMCNT